MVMLLAFFISLFARHFIQYANMATPPLEAKNKLFVTGMSIGLGKILEDVIGVSVVWGVVLPETHKEAIQAIA